MSELSDKLKEFDENFDYDKLQANFRKNYNPGFLSSVGHNLLGGVEALGGGVAKGLGQFFQSDTLEDIGDNLSNEAQNLNEIYGTNEKYKDMGFFDRLTSLDYLTDPRGLTASVTNGFGSSLPLLALTAAFPEFTIPGAIARGGAAKLLGEAGANWVARKGIDKFLNAGTKFATVSTPFDALSAQSEMIEYLRRQGYSESEITRRIIDGMIEEYPMDMLANMASGGLLMGKLPFMQGSSLPKRVLKGIGATGLDMFLGGNQEMYQDQVMKRHANLPAGTLFNPLPEEEQTRTEAMFGEMFPGVVATARDAVFGDSKTQEPPAEDQSQEFDLEQYAKPYLGQEMPNGRLGCVEAITRIGKSYSPFLQNEYDIGNASVPNLLEHAKTAGVSVIPFDASKLSKGDVIVYGDMDHVVIYDGNGGYYGNSSSRNQVVRGDDYKKMGGLEPTEIIKTGNGSVQESSQNQYDPNFSEIENRMWQNAQHVAKRMKDEFGWDVDPALIYGQWYHESGGFKSRAAKEINNFAGLMQKEPNGEENRQTDGDLYFKMYDSPEQFADDYVDSFMNPRLYPEMANVKTAEDFRDMLFGTGYVNEGSYDGYLADIKYGMANHPNVGYNGGRVTPTTQKEAGAGNQPNQTEIPRPLFDLTDLINQDNIESGLTNAIVSDYLKQLQQSGNKNQKNLANQMLDQDGEFRFTPENFNQVVQTEGQNIVDFAIENEGRYLAPQEVRERLAQQQLLRKANALYANDFETARDADEKINYWMNYGRKPKDSKQAEIKSKNPPEWNLPHSGMTQEEKDNRMQELLARRLTAEMQGDQNAIKQIETQMKQLRNAPIIDNKPSENPVQNPPADQTQQPTEDQSQVPPVEENQPKPRRTPPEILDAVKLTGKKPLDAGDLHVETMEDGSIKLLGKRNPPKSNRRKKPSEEPNSIKDLVSIAKEIGGTYNSRSKTFNFQNPEDAELFSQTAQIYLDNGFESLKPKSQSQTQQSTRPLSNTEQTIYDAIPETSSISPDELITKTGLSTSKVVANLASMEKSGIINKDDLGNFSRISSNKPKIQSNSETSQDAPSIKPTAPRNDNESKVIDALSTGNPMSIDEIIARTGIGIPKIFDTLSSMEKSGIIKSDAMDNYELTDKTQIKPQSKPKEKHKQLNYNQWLKSHEEDAKNPRIKRAIERVKEHVKNLIESYGENGNPLEMDTEIDTILRNAENAINKLKDDIAHQSPKETLDENQSNNNGDNNDNNESDEKSKKTFDTFLKNLSPKFAMEVQNALTPKLRAKIESLARDDNAEFKFENGQYTINDEQISRHAAAYLNYLRYTNGGEFLAKETPRFLETLHFELDTNRKPTDKEIADGTYIETNEHLRPLLYRKLKVSEYPELKRWIDRELKMPANGYEDELRVQRQNRLQKLWKNDISDETLKQMEDDFKADREVVIPGIDDAPETKKSPPAITLPEGYRTESGRDINEADKDEFIVDKDGNRDFGEISKEIEEITNGVVKSAPVRLTVGVHIQKGRETKGRGYKHISLGHDKDIKEKGFDNPIDFIKYVLKNFNLIYRARSEDNRILLYCDDESIGYMPMDLEIEEGNGYYTIVSAYPRRKPTNEEQVYDGRPTQPSTDSVDGATQSDDNNKDGVSSVRASEKTDSSFDESIPSNESEVEDYGDDIHEEDEDIAEESPDEVEDEDDELIDEPEEQSDSEEVQVNNDVEKLVEDWWSNHDADYENPEIAKTMDDTYQRLIDRLKQTEDLNEQLEIAQNEISRADKIIAKIKAKSAKQTTDIRDKLQKRYDDIVADARDAVDQFLARNNAQDSRDDFFTRTLDYIAARTDLKNIRNKKSFDEDEITQSLDEFESRLKSLISTETKKATQSLENKSNQSESSTQESTPKRKPKKKSIEIKEHIEETPQEILKKEHLTTHPPDAGNLHVDVQAPEINKPIEVKLEGKAKRSKVSVAIPGLTKLARHFDAMFNESQKIFKFQLLEDANLFAQTAFKYLNNGNECVTFTPIFAESNENNDDIANQDFGDAIELLDNQMEGLNGKSLKVFSDNNKEFNARYKIVDASELITSHEYLGLGYGINREYPQALQPRDRLRVAMQDGISKMAGSIVPEQITDSRYLNQGAPVVRSDGVVLNGNGRTLALITAYSRKQADKYRNYLIEHAEEFGIDADEISKMDKPILIREITDTLDQEKTQTIIGSMLGGTQLGESEQSVSDAKKLRLKDLNGYEPVKNGNISAPQNATFLNNVASRIISSSEYNKYTTGNSGSWNASAIRRVKQALMAIAYPDNELVAKMTESTDDEIKNISNALDYAKADVAHAVLMMKENHAYQYNLSETITRAVRRYDKIKQGDGNVQNFISHNETSLTDKESDEVISILRIFEANKRNASKLGEFLSGIARAVEAQGDPELGSGFFGDTIERETLMDIINRVTSSTFFEQPSLIDTQNDSSKKSMKNDKREYFKNLKILRQSQLTAREKSIQDLGKQLGVPVVFFEGNKNLHGYFAGGTSFINRNSATSLEWTFWHESFHAMQAQNPNLYNQILSEIKKSQSFTDKQIDAYRKEIGAFSLSDDEVIEEMLADNMQDAAKRSGIIDSLKGNRNLFQKFVDFVRDLYNKVKDFFNAPKNKLTQAQRDAMTRELEKIADNLPVGESLQPSFYTYDQIKFSLNNHFNNINDTFARNLGLKPTSDRINVAESKPIDDINLKQYYLGSPSRIKNETFKFFFDTAARGMRKLVQLRNKYARKFKDAMELLTDDKARDNLYELLWRGDAEGVEYGKLTSEEKRGRTVDEIDELRTDKIVRETGVARSAAKAYVKIRRLLEAVYRQLDARKRGVKTKTLYIQPKNLATFLKSFERNKFITVMRIGDRNSDGKIPVTIKQAQHWSKTAKNLTQAQVDQLASDPVIQITHSKKNSDGTFNITYRQGKAGLTRREGHIPHLFHHFTVRVKKNVNGEFVTTKELEDRLNSYHAVIGSGKSQKDAIKVAEEWLKSNKLQDGEEIFIEPQMFNFEKLGVNEDESTSEKEKSSRTKDLKYSESSYAPVMGDKDFYSMQQNIAKNHGMKLSDVKNLVAGSVRSTSRHRFNGNFLQRHGSKGFEQDIQYVLRHYLNSSARYLAMDEFKENAINKFEQAFGAFDKDWTDNSLAQYVKNYIRDVNGNPTTLEMTINNALNKSELWKKYFIPHYGDRAALSLTNSITSRLGYLTLGFLNFSSALLNFSQLINAAGYLGEAGNLGKYFCKYMKGLKSGDGRISMRDLSILTKVGTLNEIGLDSSSGYDQSRGHTSDIAVLNTLDRFGNWSMGIFQRTDALCRIATTLAAYDQAKAQGKSDAEAIKYAREINRKSNFDYSVADAPNIFRRGSVISQLALQFKKYGIKELEVMADMLSSKTSWAQKRWFWIPYLLAVGLMGVPAGDWLDWLAKDFLNIGSPKNAVQEFIMESCGKSPEGKALGRALMYGIAGSVGVNISSRVGLQDVIPTRTSDFAGVAASKTYNLIHDIRHEGLGLQAIRDVSPGAYNILAAGFGESRGARGRLNSTYDDFFERALRFIGFKSMDETLASDVQRIIYDKRDKLSDEKQDAIDAYIENPTTENARKLRKLGVKPSTVREERKRKRMERLGRMDSLLSKKERKENREMLKFAQ